MGSSSTAGELLMSLRIVRPKGASKKVGLGLSTIWAKAADPKDPFPKPIKLSEKCTGWVEAELEQWLEDRIRESRGPDIG